MTFKSQADALFYLARIHAAATYTIESGYHTSAAEAASEIKNCLHPILVGHSVTHSIEETIGPVLTYIISPNGERFQLPEDESKVWAEQFLAGGWPMAQINNAILLVNHDQ